MRLAVVRASPHRAFSCANRIHCYYALCWCGIPGSALSVKSYPDSFRISFAHCGWMNLNSRTIRCCSSQALGDLVVPSGHIFTVLGKFIHFYPDSFFFLLLFSAFPIAFWWMFLLWGVNDPMLNSLGFDIASGTFCLLLLYFLCKYCSPSFSLRLCLSVHLHDLIIINVHLNVIRLPFQLCSKALARSFMKIKCTPTVCPTSCSLKEKGSEANSSISVSLFLQFGIT